MYYIYIIIVLLLLRRVQVVELFPQWQPQHKIVRLAREREFDSTYKPLYQEPYFIDDRSVIVHLNEWKFVDIAEECRTFLGPKKFAGVQLSPVFEHVVFKSPQLLHPWWERYEIISYKIATRSGTEADFWTMSRICNEAGVRIYLDVQLHHMAAQPATYLNSSSDGEVMVETSAGNMVNISNRNYPDVPYEADDFYSACYPYNQRYCQFKQHPVLNYDRRNVKEIIGEMLNSFIDMGVAGFRIDRANLMQPSELMELYEGLKDLNVDFDFSPGSRPFIYHDVVDLYSDNIYKTEYSSLGMVSEYLYALELSKIFNRLLPLTSLINWGPALGFITHANALVFVDSHNTQRDSIKELIPKEVLTYKQYNKYLKAITVMLFHPYGSVKLLMSSYYFDDNPEDGSDAIKQAPTLEDGLNIRSPEFDKDNQCEFSSGWICEHRWPAIVNLLPFVNYFNMPDNYESSIIHFQSGGGFHQVAFCRGSKAFIAINNDPELEFNMQVYTCLQPGEYCDVLTGGLTECGNACNGRSLLVANDGYAQLNLSVADEEWNYQSEADDSGNINERNYGILLIYIASKVNIENSGEECSTTSTDSNQLTEPISTEHPDISSSTVAVVEATEETTEEPTSEIENVEGEARETETETETVEGETIGPENTEGVTTEPSETETETTEGETIESENTEGEPSETETETTEGEAIEHESTEGEPSEPSETETTEGEAIEPENTEGEPSEPSEPNETETETTEAETIGPENGEGVPSEASETETEPESTEPIEMENTEGEPSEPSEIETTEGEPSEIEGITIENLSESPIEEVSEKEEEEEEKGQTEAEAEIEAETVTESEPQAEDDLDKETTTEETTDRNGSEEEEAVVTTETENPPETDAANPNIDSKMEENPENDTSNDKVLTDNEDYLENVLEPAVLN